MKCDLCEWENFNSDIHLVDWLSKNHIKEIDLCNYHIDELSNSLHTL